MECREHDGHTDCDQYFWEPPARRPWGRGIGTASKHEVRAAALTGAKVSAGSLGMGAYGNGRTIDGMAELPIAAYSGWGRQERGIGSPTPTGDASCGPGIG